nr:MAG TPA: hypothetical protein [Bacteriophage sp.]
MITLNEIFCPIKRIGYLSPFTFICKGKIA